MRDHLLFIDTEGSGLPKKWDLPYSVEDNWPFSVQVSWLIYTKEGEQVKQENHYISDNDFIISPSALKIHGITHEFLKQHGESRTYVMQKLHDDLLHYQPIVVGHFIELDIHMAGADFYRAGIENLISSLPTFCTMLATKHLVRNAQTKYLMLGDLYNTLFNKILKNQHDALVDAKATADCFFAMLKRGDINEKIIENQKVTLASERALDASKGCSLFLFVLLLLVISIAFWL